MAIEQGAQAHCFFVRSVRLGKWLRLGFPQLRPGTCHLRWRVGSLEGRIAFQRLPNVYQYIEREQCWQCDRGHDGRNLALGA